MSNTFASRAADTVLPPALSANDGFAKTTGANVALNNVQQLACSNVAAKSDLGWAAFALTADPTRNFKAYVEFQVVSGGSSVFVAFKKGNAAASVTTTTGWEIPAGTSKSFFISSTEVDNVEAICASGTATLKWYVNSFYE